MQFKLDSFFLPYLIGLCGFSPAEGYTDLNFCQYMALTPWRLPGCNWGGNGQGGWKGCYRASHPHISYWRVLSHLLSPICKGDRDMASSYVPRRVTTMLFHVELSSFSYCSHPRKALSPRPTRVANHPSAGRREVALVKKQRLCDKARADREPQ